MDNLQDVAFNQLTILDHSCADHDKSGCAVFAGGINVEKNIIVNEIDTQYLHVKKILKVHDSIIVQNEIKVDGCIQPIDQLNYSSLGTITNKWHKIYATDVHLQNMNAINVNCKNANIINLNLSNDVINLNIAASTTNKIYYVLSIDTIILFINLPLLINDQYEIYIKLNKPIRSNEYHKIIFNQKNNCNIYWNINQEGDITSKLSEQIFEIISINSEWHIINNLEHNNLICNFNEINIKIDNLVTNVNKNNIKINNLVTNVNQNNIKINNLAANVNQNEIKTNNLIHIINKIDLKLETMFKCLNKTIELLDDNLENAIKKIKYIEKHCKICNE
jgi:hypothetical protein